MLYFLREKILNVSINFYRKIFFKKIYYDIEKAEYVSDNS